MLNTLLVLRVKGDSKERGEGATFENLNFDLRIFISHTSLPPLPAIFSCLFFPWPLFWP